jgi:hypothetical protein
MPAPKTPEQSSGKQTPQPTLPRPQQAPARKPWKKKTPVEVVLEQEEKLRKEIAETEEELRARKAQLAKFEQARKLFEGS